MNLSVAARAGVLISIVAACSHPAMAQQHHNAPHPQAGGHTGQVTHPGNAGMGHVTPQQVQQQQRAIQQQQRAYEQQQRAYMQQMHQQYQKQVQQFENFLKSRGQTGGSSRLPKDPAAFDRWAAAQKKNKAQGKSYDPLYDHFRSFAGEAEGSNGRGTHSKKGSAAAAQGTNKQNAAHEAKAKAEHQAREAAREAAARKSQTHTRSTTAQDQAKVSMLRTVHTRLAEADHDYNGHRVQAMHEVRRALEHLGGSNPGGIGGGSSLGNMPQSQSDGVLRDSLLKLKVVHGQLASGAAPHHAQARVAVAEAIRHLEGALRVN